jgi:hypothetical protein
LNNDCYKVDDAETLLKHIKSNVIYQLKENMNDILSNCFHYDSVQCFQQLIANESFRIKFDYEHFVQKAVLNDSLKIFKFICHDHRLNEQQALLIFEQTKKHNANKLQIYLQSEIRKLKIFDLKMS